MSQSIDLAGLAHWIQNSLTLHCFLTWNSNQNAKISLPSPQRLTQHKSASHPQLGLGLGSLPTPSKTARAIPVFKRKLRGHLGRFSAVAQFLRHVHRLSQQIHFTVTHEYERVSKIVKLQKTFRLPYEWLLPQEIHCISSDRNNSRQQTWRDLTLY